MRPLYYSCFGPPHVAKALATQTHESLRPFVAYLNAAKAAARAREARSRCTWEAVPLESPLKLKPLDSLAELSRSGARYRVVGVPAPAPQMPLFVGPEHQPHTPRKVDERGGMLVIELDQALAPGLAAYWKGQKVQLERIEDAWPQDLVARRPDGRSLQIRARFEVRGSLRLVVEGTAPFELLSSGSVVEHKLLAENDGATLLRSGEVMIPWNGGSELFVATLPTSTELVADNGVRWTWTDGKDTRRRRGEWIQLLAPEERDDEATVDPRAAFCEEGVREVRTQKGKDKRDGFRVLGVRRDDYRLELDRLPPPGSTIFLPSNLSGLSRQLDAIYRLKDSPLPHHRGILTLCEDPQKVRWPEFVPEQVTRWYLLADDRWDGTTEQRAFVEKALGSPDFAFLEGPPGSGKTHAICELILQLIERKQRVLLCSTTHVAVDNVLERLVERFPQVEAVRIGLAERVDPRMVSQHLDKRIEQLQQVWRENDVFSELDDDELNRAAAETVLASANLTCGTTTGILAHPYLQASTEQGGPRWPHFDVLVIDEASKTTFQEFLVPAQLAPKWVIVGDVRQLPPFTDPRDLEASLADVSQDSKRLSDAHQRACLLLFRLGRREAGAGRVRWLVEEPSAVLDAMVLELDARAARGEPTPDFVRITEQARHARELSVADVNAGARGSLWLTAAAWVLVTREVRAMVEPFLPPDLLGLRASAAPASLYRFEHWTRARGKFRSPVRDRQKSFADVHELLAEQRKFFEEETWAKEVAWRLGRVHQLHSAKNDQNRLQRQQEVDSLVPAAPEWSWVEEAVDAIRDVGVRSVIESLRVARVDHRVRRKSALTEAIPPDRWQERSVLLRYQHRMHPDISALPRSLFYEGAALHDANTLAGRDERAGWRFYPEAKARRVWLDVAGHESDGVNGDEVEAMLEVLKDWEQFAAEPRQDGKRWEVACLAFYNRQEIAMRDMLRRHTRMNRAETRFDLPNTTIVCATVDRFQGREADLVLLSLRNTKRAGHLDIPNRLNVGITRARFLLVVIGNRMYFEKKCPSEELTKLAQLDVTPALMRKPHT